MRALAEMLPDKLRERIASEPFPELWVAAFQARLSRGERDAVRLYPELLRMVGAADDMTEIAKAALGVASMAQAQSLIGMARSVESVDRATLIEWSRKLLADEGWTCLPPSANANGTGPEGNGHAEG